MITVVNRYSEHGSDLSNRCCLWSQAQAHLVKLLFFSEGCLALCLILFYTSQRRIQYSFELHCWVVVIESLYGQRRFCLFLR